MILQMLSKVKHWRMSWKLGMVFLRLGVMARRGIGGGKRV